MWQPTAHLDTLRLRANLYTQIRHFFAVRQVLEVETPILSPASIPEPSIEPLYTHYRTLKENRLFLQTSPELAMKRLLAAGSGAIYQISKAFRDGEMGRWHNPEFTLLEWYRPGFTTHELIQEIDELLQTVLHTIPAEQVSYCDLFEHHTGFHPLQSSLTVLHNYAQQYGFQPHEQTDRDTYLHLIVSQHIEPKLGYARPLFVTDFPFSQAALARKNPHHPELAERFELYIQGIELANGFYELTDPVEQRQRFEQDLAKRHALNLPTHPLDEAFLVALAELPDCAGVALGLDRLLMIMIHATHIREVIAFPLECSP